MAPFGIRGQINWIRQKYGNIELYITENGISDRMDKCLDDEHRVNYYRLYINEVLKGMAHNRACVNLQIYIVIYLFIYLVGNIMLSND